MITLRASSYHLETTEDDESRVDTLFEDAGIPQHRYGTTLAVVLEDGQPIGALTESGSGEWSVAVDDGFRGSGLATQMIQAVLADGGTGFLVAGSEDGAGFIYTLYFRLSEDERESLEVPSWDDLEGMMDS